MCLRNMEQCADLLVIPAISLLGRYLELAWMMETVMECGVADRSSCTGKKRKFLESTMGYILD